MNEKRTSRPGGRGRANASILPFVHLVVQTHLLRVLGKPAHIVGRRQGQSFRLTDVDHTLNQGINCVRKKIFSGGGHLT